MKKSKVNKMTFGYEPAVVKFHVIISSITGIETAYVVFGWSGLARLKVTCKEATTTVFSTLFNMGTFGVNVGLPTWVGLHVSTWIGVLHGMFVPLGDIIIATPLIPVNPPYGYEVP